MSFYPSNCSVHPWLRHNHLTPQVIYSTQITMGRNIKERLWPEEVFAVEYFPYSLEFAVVVVVGRLSPKDTDQLRILKALYKRD